MSARVAGVSGGGETLENKALKELPDLSLASVSDASFGAEFSDYVWDHLPFRGPLLKWDHILDYYVFGDTPVPGKIVVGLNGFVFVQERIHGKRSGAMPGIDITLKAVKSLEATAKKAGVPLVIVISPNKASIYPENLPPEFRAWFEENVLSVTAALEEYADREGTALINMWRPLREEKARLAEVTSLFDERLRTVFRPHDRHWSLETGRLQGAEIVRAIAGVEWDARYGPAFSGEYTYAVSELSEVYMKLGPLEPYDRLVNNPRLNMRRTRLPNQVNVFRSLPKGELKPAKKTLLVLRDSFLNNGEGGPANRLGGGMQAIAPFFRQSIFIHLPTALKEPAKVLAHEKKADLMVIQVVQGNVGNLVAHNRTIRRKIIEIGKAKRARAKVRRRRR